MGTTYYEKNYVWIKEKFYTKINNFWFHYSMNFLKFLVFLNTYVCIHTHIHTQFICSYRCIEVSMVLKCTDFGIRQSYLILIYKI